MPFLARLAVPRLAALRLAARRLAALSPAAGRVAALGLALAIPSGVDAARDLANDPAQLSDVELIVVEAAGCTYCDMFRQVVAPRYRASPRSAHVPLRYADVNEVDGLALDAPVTIVPTLLVLRERREIGRLAGYVGPESFFRVLDRLLPTAE